MLGLILTTTETKKRFWLIVSKVKF